MPMSKHLSPVKHKNIPIFIPHMGCPHRCVFCDQRAISGHGDFDVDRMEQEIKTAVGTLTDGVQAEIAFFGGSFTAIDRGLMLHLLDIAQRYVDAGAVSGIRFSTRPDAVGEDVLDALSSYTITAIELGLQSMDDAVLHLAARGCTAETAREACRRVVEYGYPLVGQMMGGLPGATEQSERQTAREICALGATAARVYPVVVFDNTPLSDMMRRGDYVPLDNEQAVLRCARVLDVLEEQGVACLRVGLCASEVLQSSRVLGGANHPALGELVYGALWYARMCTVLERCPQAKGKSVVIEVPRGKLSQAVGQHRCNVSALKARFALRDVRVCESPTVGVHDRSTVPLLRIQDNEGEC